MTGKRGLLRSKSGMTAITTVMILIILISLIVIGFSRLTRRNQVATLDRQKATQAFYAAETGINDVKKLIIDGVRAGRVIPDKDQCTTGASFYNPLQRNIDAAKDISYSCILVDTKLDSLKYQNVGFQSVVIPIISDQPVSKIFVNARPTSNDSPDLAGCAKTFDDMHFNDGNNIPEELPIKTGWTCDHGLLRMDVMPYVGSLTVDSAKDNTMSLWTFPSKQGAMNGGVVTDTGGAVPINYDIDFEDFDPRSMITRGVCAPQFCLSSIHFGAGWQTRVMYVRVQSVYKNSDIELTGTDTSGNPIQFKNAQALIDSTGKAGDVLKRIQVRLPLQTGTSNDLSDYAIQTTDSLCKRFSVMDNWSGNSGSAGGTSRLCTAW